MFAIPHIMENIVKMVFMQIAKYKKRINSLSFQPIRIWLVPKSIWVGLQLVSINLFDTLNQIDQLENAVNILLFI